MESDFGSSAPSSSWVTKWLRVLKRGEDIFKPCGHSNRPQDPLTGVSVLEFLSSTPFASTSWSTASGWTGRGQRTRGAESVTMRSRSCFWRSAPASTPTVILAELEPIEVDEGVRASVAAV
jgi:hypothetical protein